MVAILNVLNTLLWIFIIMCGIGTVVCVGSFIIIHDLFKEI